MKQSRTYLVAGASSTIAEATLSKISSDGHRAIAISRKFSEEGKADKNQLFIEDYSFGKFPEIGTPLNGLVYFPGTINLKPFNRLTENDFKNDFSVHVMGAVAFIQKYLPLLDKNSSPSIVLISSVAALSGMPYHASVSISKGALDGLVRALAAELAPSIRVNAVAPSLVKTAMTEKFINTPEKKEAMENRNPLRKIGSPEEISNAITFLLSEEASWITGQVLSVDGGMNNLKL